MDDPDWMHEERVVSWRAIWSHLYPDPEEQPHDNDVATEMHRLRGLIMAQACETEAVLGQILRFLRPSASVGRPAGALLGDIRKELATSAGREVCEALDLIGRAVQCRNRAVHGSIEIGSVWESHGIVDGRWVPVISLMGDEAYDEGDLRTDFVLQQQATTAAVKLLHSLLEMGAAKEGGGIVVHPRPWSQAGA